MRKQIWENLVFSGGLGATKAENNAEGANDHTNAGSSSASVGSSSLQLAADVDFGALSVKYELTGGFIKVIPLVGAGCPYLLFIQFMLHTYHRTQSRRHCCPHCTETVNDLLWLKVTSSKDASCRCVDHCTNEDLTRR
jgi:hypothetical protein